MASISTRSGSPSYFTLVYQNPLWVFLGLSVTLSIWYILFPDVVPLHNGFAWEGDTYYKPVAINLPHELLETHINSYTIQRIFPFVLLHGFFRLFDIPFRDEYLILWMQIFNLGVGVLMIVLWHKTAKLLNLSLEAAWVGFLAFFVNFSFLKYDLYIPFTTDRLAAAAGLMSLYFYLRRSTLGLWLTALVSLNIWPTALAYNLLLLLIPADEPLPKTSNRPLSLLWAAGVSLLIMLLFVGVLYVRDVPLPPRMAPEVRPLLPLGIVLTGIYVFYTQWTLGRRLIPGWAELGNLLLRTLRPSIKWLYILALLAAYIELTRVIGDPSRSYLPFKTFLINTTYAVLQRPLQFVVAHGVYYGLAALIPMLFWRRLLAVLDRLGLGLGLMLMVVMLQAINSETRQLANVLPLLALIAALVADTFSLNRAAVWTVAVLLVLISKAWLPFNWFDPTFGQPADRFPSFSFVHNGIMLEWPFQVYFMNQGPWISNFYLLLQGGILAVVGFVVYKAFTRSRLGDNAAAGRSH
ncbi:hypothetical protein [Hymenobacter jeollabukensis]|uniref:DUF2029 domain-containing protein n=1 Tax=Hymenobacter jeollabukensis TaxID=2025313 RepID=A0A5R8WSA0_9BACT|nr:hypothetical protein [Hymenobacter jeollabukensis]TLM93251.1 hypothetical protein FDY95_11565 [Hymenobacter jeollabukensis]